MGHSKRSGDVDAANILGPFMQGVSLLGPRLTGDMFRRALSPPAVKHWVAETGSGEATRTGGAEC